MKQQNSPFIVPLSGIRRADLPRVGSKAANLGLLLEARLPVPSGFCVTTEAFRSFIAQCPDNVYAALYRVGGHSMGALQEAGMEVRRYLSRIPIPREIEQAVIHAWEAHGSALGYAVRSSATAEDLPEASFAGQQDSFLHVRGSDLLLGRIRDCWISLFSDRAIASRTRNGIGHRDAAMAVIVQEMIDARVSGILFTADPLSGDRDRIVIESCWGLGEALSAGKVNPDRMIFDRRLRLRSHTVSEKTIETVPGREGEVFEQPVPPERRNEPSLDKKTALRLCRTALAVERLRGAPQDIEWALRGTDIFLLQSRPVTAIGQTAVERRVWSNVNVGELLPDVATPMSWSIVNRYVRTLFSGTFSRLGIEADNEPMLGLVAGRIYADIGTFARLIDSFPGPFRMDINELFGGCRDPRLSPEAVSSITMRMKQPWSRRLRILVRLPGLALWVLTRLSAARALRFFTDFRKRVDALAQRDVRTMTDEALIPHIRSLLLEGMSADDGMAYAGIGMGCGMAVYRLTGRWLGDTGGATASKLLSGTGGMGSAEPALELWQLAAWAREFPSLRDVILEARTFAEMRTQLLAYKEGKMLLFRWDGFMLRHGHHTRSELDIFVPRWSETPDAVLSMVKSYMTGMLALDPPGAQRRRQTERQHLLAECRRKLRDPVRRRLLELLLDRARRGLLLRENFKNEIIRMIASLRRALLELGERMVARRILKSRDDVFFFELQELEPAFSNRAGFHVPGTIASRRTEYVRNRSLTPPPVIVGDFDPAIHASCSGDWTPVNEFKGLSVSPGTARGPARVVMSAGDGVEILPGEILIAPFTDPGWAPYFLTAAAVVMDMGGILSHGSIVAREYGIPAVVNVGRATQSIKTGQMIEVDGYRGIVTILSQKE